MSHNTERHRKSRMSKFLEKVIVVTRPSENLQNAALKEAKYLPKIFLEGTVINDKFISLIQLLCSIEFCSNLLADVALTSHPHSAPRFSVNRQLYLYSLSVNPMTCCGHRRQYVACVLHARYLRLQTHTQNMQYLLLFHFKNGYANAPVLLIYGTRDIIKQ